MQLHQLRGALGTIWRLLESSCTNSCEKDKVSRTTPSQSHTEAGTLRKRAQRACRQCHAHKTKCSGDLPRCKRCDAANLPCEYTPAKRKFANVPVKPSSNPEEVPSSGALSIKSQEVVSPSSSVAGVAASFPLTIDVSVLTTEELLVRKHILLRHIDAYFEHLYWIPCLGFLHPETTYRQIQDGTFNPAQAAAVSAIASVFVESGEASREFGRKCSDQVEFHLFRNIYRFDEDALMLYALCGAFNFLNGSFAKCWQCLGIATRLMLGLQANWEVGPRKGTFVQQECQRRIAWQIFTIDRLLAGGYEEYISCRAENMRIRLPCNEAAFRENRPVIAERLSDRPGQGRSAVNLHAYQLRVIDIRHRIQVLTRKVEITHTSNNTKLEPSNVMADINELQNELSRINFSLPEDLRLSDQSIARYMASPERAGYVFLQTHLLACHIDLYRWALPGMRDPKSIDFLQKLPREFIVKSQKQAVAHAICQARFCDVIQKEVEKQPAASQIAGDCTIVHMSTQCLRVLLIAIQYGLYRDLTDHTTAPLWRNEPADEAHIRSLVTSLIKISEPWCDILQIAGVAHERNKAMVREFDQTRTFADLRGTAGFAGPQACKNTRLPGPNFILEGAQAGTREEEQRSRAGDAAAADRWFSTPQPSPNKPFAASRRDAELDAEPRPPGLPMFLARARGTSPSPDTAYNPYFDDDDDFAVQGQMWPVPEFNAIMPVSHSMLPAAGISMVPIGGAPDGQAFQPTSSAPPPSQAHFMPPPPQGMFMGGYTGQYQGGHNDPSYMPQTSFG
ncbi:transcriptional regulatory protein [Paramyrothecium foliicola]|nr:transcriptional regulatory protein [Paramyrothecium foliicola]